MFAVIKKELKSYLLSPIGYVFIGIFLLLFSVFFYISIFSYQSMNFEYLFYNGATILTFVAPVLTMGMFAAERKSGTEQLILTSPRSITALVLGKLLAAGIILIITEGLTLMYFAILKYFGNPSLKVALSTLFGFFLLSLAYLSFGMFASALTESQIVAYFLTTGAFLLMWFLPDINQVFETFSLIAMFDKFPRGLITVSEVVTFVSFCVLFILLTIIVLQRRKSVK